MSQRTARQTRRTARRLSLDRRRPGARIAVMSVAVLPVVLASGAAGAASQASYVRALSATFATSAGVFTLSGAVNVVYPTDPVIPPNPIRATLQNTSATNGSLTCRATGTVSHPRPSDGADVSFIATYRPFAPAGPCDPLEDLRVHISISTDGAGDRQVTAQVLGSGGAGPILPPEEKPIDP